MARRPLPAPASSSPASASARAGEPPRGETAGVDAEPLLSPAVRRAIAEAVERSGGAEVVLFGRVDEEGVVAAVEVASRGNHTAAPALVERAAGWDVALHNHPSGVLLPSDADLAVATALAERGVGSFIVSNDATRVHVVVPVRRAAPVAPVTGAEVEAFLGPRGPIAAVLGPGYEPRRGQVLMARRVAEALAGDGVALLEAGTGTGKTFAYLAPAALFALRNREERVAVSTATIHLQEQVAHKDVPLLRRALEAAGVRPRLEAVVVKGRGNYVSLRRAEEAAALDPLLLGSDEERRDLERLVAWAATTRTGDRAELTPPPTAEAWEHVESQADNCLGARCPRFDACHYFSARRAAARAHVVIVNHHLLFSDLAIKEAMGSVDKAGALPPFRRLVLDEAHHVEAIAGEHFGLDVSERGLVKALGRLARKGDAARGVLPALRAALSVGGEARRALARTIDDELLPLRAQVGAEVEAAFARLADDARDALPEAEREARDARLRLRPEHAALLGPALEAGEGVGVLGARLARLAEDLALALDAPGAPAAGDGRAHLEALGREVAAIGRRLARAATSIAALRGADDEAAGRVRWVEVSRDVRGRDRAAARAAPLDVGPLLRRAAFDPLRTVVLSSATLTVDRSFDYLEARLGLAGPGAEAVAARVAREAIPSPFDFGRQALLGVPSDLPPPEDPGYDAAVAEAVRRAVAVSGGRAFVLFTAYGALTRAFRALEGPLRAAGLTPLRQGERGRSALLAEFKAAPGAVLFGTDSFWEGVDVPGDRLVLVVIARLPFRVPSDPLQEARAEALARRGGDPFTALQLPQAVIKLKQGFGRLVRTATDRGAVLVLDQRIVTRAYGGRFLQSLPPVRLAVEPLPRLLETIRPYVVR